MNRREQECAGATARKRRRSVDALVAGIVEDVRTDGDAALRKYTLRFDGVRLGSLRAEKAEWDEGAARRQRRVQARPRERRRTPPPLRPEAAQGLPGFRVRSRARRLDGPADQPRPPGGDLCPGRPVSVIFLAPHGRRPGAGRRRRGDRGLHAAGADGNRPRPRCSRRRAWRASARSSKSAAPRR